MTGETEVDVEGEIGELETVEEQLEQQTPEVKKPHVADLIPEKYRGKSVEDIVKMHQDTERSLSRQGQELGEIRRLADELLKLQLQKPKDEEKLPEVDFFENPREAVRREVESNPALLEAQRIANQTRQAQTVQLLKQMHPDYQQIIQDQQFQEWVGKSKVRQHLLKAADSYDLDAANELFSTFKELKAVRAQKQDDGMEAQAREKSLQAASVDSGGSGERGKKVYRRADLIQLQIKNPAKFAALSDEITKAYAEGRVR
ncbi:hypothetical protein KC963_01280 [Candidatus Saccharibacteria bacterium]|nr:hypothetical protein [Candidatus Saccharibacteria bacterium]